MKTRLFLLMCVGMIMLGCLAEASTVLVNSGMQNNDVTGVNVYRNMKPSEGWQSAQIGGNAQLCRVTDKGWAVTMPGLANNQALQLKQGDLGGTVQTKQQGLTFPLEPYSPPGAIAGMFYWKATDVYTLSFNACELATQAGAGVHNEITVNINQNARPANPVRELLWTTTINLDGTHPGGTGDPGDWKAGQTFNLTIHASDFLVAEGGWLELEFVGGGAAGAADQYLDNVYLTETNRPLDPSIHTGKFCYLFNEGAGTTVESSMGKTTGTDPNIYNWDNIIWETSDCPDGSCVVFDGTNRKYKWFNGCISGPEYTLAFWAKPDPIAGTNNAVIAIRKNSSDWVTNIPVRATIPNSSGNIALSAGRFFPFGALYTGVHHTFPMNYAGAWHHYAFVKSLANGGTVEMYIDGVLVESALSNDQDVLIGHDFYLGGDEWNGRYVGKLDNLMLFSSPLTQQEIVLLAKGPGGSVVQPPLVDIDGDGKADMADLSRISSLWLEDVSLWPLN